MSAATTGYVNHLSSKKVSPLSFAWSKVLWRARGSLRLRTTGAPARPRFFEIEVGSRSDGLIIHPFKRWIGSKSAFDRGSIGGDGFGLGCGW